MTEKKSKKSTKKRASRTSIYKHKLKCLEQDSERVKILEESLKHIKADYENLKKRITKTIEEASLQASIRILKRILPILDNLDRALQSTSNTTDLASLREGFILIKNQMQTALAQEGLEKIGSVGDNFDPYLHEAMMIEANPQVQGEIISEIFEPGYSLKNHLLRACKVKVTKGSPEPKEEYNPKLKEVNNG